MEPDLHLDFTWEDTPRGTALVHAFQRLARVEQTWALKQASELAHDRFRACAITPAQADQAWSCAERWPVHRERRHRRLAWQAFGRWLLHPWGQVGRCRKETWHRWHRLGLADERRTQRWTHWMSVQALGLDPLVTLLDTLPVQRPIALEQTALRTVIDRQARRRRVQQALLSPVYLTGRLWGAIAEAWHVGQQHPLRRPRIDPPEAPPSPPASARTGLRGRPRL